MNKIMLSIIEEVQAMRSGLFPPYHKMALMMATLTCVIFSILFSHGVVIEGKISVIDLDHSSFSQELIEQINASAYIDVADVYHSPVNPAALTVHEHNLGVLYLPQNLEKDLSNGHRQINLGYLADYSNEAQNASVIEELNAIVGQISGQMAGISVARMGLAENETQAAISPFAVKVRRLFDPVYSATNTTVTSFIYFFSSLYLGITTLMIMGRLHQSGMFETVLARGPLAMMARLLPYALFYTTAITLMYALLILFGQLRFDGSYLLFLPSVFMTAMCIGLIALFMSWNTGNPGEGASFMILIVPPGFIMGGATMAIGFLPEWAYTASHAFPLVWGYKIYRDIALRGQDFLEMTGIYGMFLLYMLVLMLAVTYRWYRSCHRVQTGGLSPR